MPARDWMADRRETLLPLLAWAAVIAVAHAWGRWLIGHEIFLSAPPLYARPDVRLGPLVLPALAVGATALATGPGLAARLSWRRLLWASAAAAALWAVSLALVDGWIGLTHPVTSRAEYLHDVALVGSPGDFLASFTDRIDMYATHVRGHPPGMVLALWGLGDIGLGSRYGASALMIGGGVAAVPAVLVALAELAGQARARAAAPYLALAPMAVWIATSADAFYAGAGAWAVALAVLATGRAGRRSDALAVGGGALFGVALLFSYGIVLLAAIPLAVSLARRRLRPLALTALAALPVLIAAGAAGFSWPDGLAATRHEYLESKSQFRPYGYFLLANLAAFTIAVGPAGVAGLARLRARGPWLLVGGALAAVAVADASGMSKAEVERIWLPFAPWVLVATCSLPGDLRSRRRWLAAQLATALAVQLLVRTAW